MASRLDRLFVLLETGSTPSTRKAAAQQLGQVQKLHPHELHTLLSKVHKKCLKSTSWETRIAAGQAVESILLAVPVWDPPTINLKVEKIENEPNEDDKNDHTTSRSKLKFESFDIERLLSSDCKFLMASEANVFDDTSNSSNTSNAADVDPIKQRNLINKRLGLDIAEKIGLDTTDIISNDDLIIHRQDSTISIKEELKNSKVLLKSNSLMESIGYDENLSSREINLAKRRARKQRSKEMAAIERQSSSSSSFGGEKKLKREDSLIDDNNSENGDLVSDQIDENTWPLDNWVNILINDLFHPNWVVRHGSATALREVIRIQGQGAGKYANKTSLENEKSHQIWLEDLALRLVSVLALDRFGDFVSDSVVAPVRETTSQCLGTLLTLLSSENILKLEKILIRLLNQESWECRHGSLLALKYMFALRKDLVEDLLPIAFPSIFKALSDSVDDVCAVAASSLIPVTEQLIVILSSEETSKIVNVLWDSLSDLDDLSSSCNSIMSLLANILQYPKARNNVKGLDNLMPKIWPFLHHASSSVRKSSLLTLQKLTELDSTVSQMSVLPLQETLKHLFQRALLENNNDVLQLIPRVWVDILKSSKWDHLLCAACPYFATWLCLTMQPPRLQIDPALLVSTKSIKHKNQQISSASTDLAKDKVFMSGSGDGDPTKIAQTRIILAEMLGQLTPFIIKSLPVGMNGEPPLESYSRIVLTHLNSRSALQRFVTSLVIASWAKIKHDQNNHETINTRLNQCLSENIYFDEIALAFTKLQSESRDFLATLKHYKIALSQDMENSGILSVGTNTLFTFDQIQVISGNGMEEIIKKLKKPKVQEVLSDRRKTLWNISSQTMKEFTALNIMTLAALSGSVCNLNCLPQKLNPVVKPLMEAIRAEENQLLQKLAAENLCYLINLVINRSPCPIPKIIQNLTTFLCCDEEFTPPINDSEGILSLANYTVVETSSSSTSKKSTVKTAEEKEKDEQKKIVYLKRRGASFALTKMVSFFGAELPSKISKLWELWDVLNSSNIDSAENMKKVIDALQIFEVISPFFHSDLYPTIEDKVGRLTSDLLQNKTSAVRHMSSRCLATWTSLITDKLIPIIVKEIVPRLESQHKYLRQGAIEAIYCIVDKLGLDLLPYIVLLVVPVLGRMSDFDESVRMLASLTFSKLVGLMPLEGGVPEPLNLPADLVQQKGEQRKFLEQLLNPRLIPTYDVTIPIKAELRPYQQSGINWLGFLNKYLIHGILCDDMGLGKTLQSICILANDHKLREEKRKMDKTSADYEPVHSIVICPPTLTGHWVYEIEKFVSSEYINPLHYHGPPVERNKLKPRLKHHNLIVASYDIVRNDIDFFSSIRWNYCILDEGHIIKNGKTKISKAIKQLRANHRLILSGTPIQNNVLELWSLFDFLMPGFLGTEKQFSVRFAKPILMSRDPKSSPKEQEAGALAMESLHRQTLPFLLRRLKEDVLQDLPPKITQDYYCDLSSIQEQLYEDFARTKAHLSLRENYSSIDDSSKHSHIFQALQYLRKVCNHPKLVLSPNHPKYTSIMSQLEKEKSSLNDISLSAKLPALKQLLLDCGIGVVNSNESNVDVVNQHRALIFCQLKAMLDILERDLFKVHMPSVTYLRLDGSVPAGHRHSLVHRFNNDPSIDILLLTTQVGGLGLNLTGADVVIFIDHDYNPTRDLQAMDRAHRIGQKKVVNVYRLITKGTLEEKIMSLQKFKLMTANTIISQENSRMETMATDQVLDLFVLEDNKDQKKQQKVDDVSAIAGYKNFMENIPELWDDKLYEDEYDLTSFIKNLGNK